MEAQRLSGASRDAAQSNSPGVVIVGAGFGGLAAAQALQRAPIGVTIIDRHDYTLFPHLLYRVAMAANWFWAWVTHARGSRLVLSNGSGTSADHLSARRALKGRTNE